MQDLLTYKAIGKCSRYQVTVLSHTVPQPTVLGFLADDEIQYCYNIIRDIFYEAIDFKPVIGNSSLYIQIQY